MNQIAAFECGGSTNRATDGKRRSIGRATTKSLAAHNANFSMDGLRFHFAKLSQYTNPTGGALDKIPLNTKAYTAAYYAQWEEDQDSPPSFYESAPWIDPVIPRKKLFLRKKALYHVADHLLGIGKKAYWTGSTRQSTLLGLDIDDHESLDETDVQANAEQALRLFVELTGLHPVPSKSPGGINAFLICHKLGATTEQLNEIWHSLVRIVNAEAIERGLVARLECKGKARIFNEEKSYCGVQFKDPLWSLNPTDQQMHEFWQSVEANATTAPRLKEIIGCIANTIDLTQFQCQDEPEPELDPIMRDLEVLGASTAHILTIGDPGNRYWTDLKQKALDGVTIADQLYEAYLQPLAQALFFRDFARNDNRADLTKAVLLKWVLHKSNGNVSRSQAEVATTIDRLVDNLDAQTCRAVKDYWLNILIEDVQYPHRVQLISSYMGEDGEISTLLPASLSDLLIVDDGELPKEVMTRIRKVASTLRYEYARNRFTSFAIRFVNHLYHNGRCGRSIGWKVINQMLGEDGDNRQTQQRYKGLLVTAGLIESGWENYIRRYQAAAKYKLTKVAAYALKQQRQEKAKSA